MLLTLPIPIGGTIEEHNYTVGTHFVINEAYNVDMEK